MKIRTFRIGGIHPEENKLTHEVPTQVAPLPKQAIFPLSQHIGAPAKPVVAKGDVVKVGTLLAEAGGFVSAPIYSSVSGKVLKIDSAFDASGYRKPAIIVSVEGDEWEESIDRSDKLVKIEDRAELTPESIVESIKKAGITGMGGAGFPTQVKLAPKEPEKIDHILVNGAECEPYLTSDYRRMLDDSEKLIEGLRVMLKLFDNAKGILGIEDNKPDCIEKLTELTKDEPRIEVCPLMTKYPQGGERQLIYATTGRAINSKMLPADAGCIVDNVETIIAVYNAVKNGQPVLKRISTVTGDAVKNPSNILYSIGTSYQELVDAAGGFKSQPEKIISGGPMMGFAMFSLDIPTTKTSSSILCFTHDEVAAFEPQACINCGRCVEACPEQLIPSRLAKFGLHGQMDEFEKWHGLECIECGSCSFVCPSRRQVAQPIKTMKKLVLAEKRKQTSKK